LNAEQTVYTGIDREGPLSNPTVVGSAESLPFENESFDVVLSTQVFEHLVDPAAAMKEAVRVLKRGGRLILTVPGVWPTHEAPHDYWRFTRHGLHDLLNCNGISGELVAQGRLWATVGQMINLELSRHGVLRELVPFVNLIAKFADSRTVREDLVLNWFVDGTRL
jgi:SAM-dependent methyltransferase